MDATWHQIARQCCDLPAYLALLRSQELPTRIVSALDCLPQDPAALEDIESIVSLLLQMIESKWSFGPVSPEHQRVLDYAHDWASETLLTATTPSGSDPSMPCQSSDAVEAMQRELFLYHAVTEDDHLLEIEQSIQDTLSSNGASIRASELTELLEACATHIHDDKRFLELVEWILSNGSGRELSVLGQGFRARLLKREDNRRLLDSVPIITRLCVWESDLALWTEQLDHWLCRVHEEPFVPVTTITGFASQKAQAPSSPLYVSLIAWASRTERRKLYRATRSRELLTLVSRFVGNEELEANGFSRRLLEKVPRTIRGKPSYQWSLKQRAFVLQTVAQALPRAAQDSRHQWLEYIGLVEWVGIVHHAIDSFVTSVSRGDSEMPDRAHGIQVFAWHEAYVYDAHSAEQKRESVYKSVNELAEILRGVSVSQSGVQWLQEHRAAAFVTMTPMKLRILWCWLLNAVYSVAQQPEVGNVRAVLESIEYIIRRNAPAEESRLFQIEVLASFLHEWEWYRERHVHSEPTQKSVGVVMAWLAKLVRLLPQEATDPQTSTNNLSQQLDIRLNWTKLNCYE